MSQINNEFYAYPPEYSMVEAVMRFQAVKRWHMIDTTRQQTLAEHSANVAALVYLLCTSCPEAYFATADATIAALFHDMPEVFTGDIPSLSKTHIDGLDELEHEVTPAIAKIVANSSSRLLIKLCDLADGIRFIRLHGVDITGTHAKTGLEEKFKSKLLDAREMWPEIVADHVQHYLTFYIYEKS
jgi:hypothetical protein